MNTPYIQSIVLFACSTIVASTCFAARMSVFGNRELSPSNYTDWPGIDKAINDKSRVFQVWVNGNESFSYSGNTDALNRVLEKFGKTDVPKLTVFIRPAIGETVQSDEESSEKIPVDWKLQVVGGIVRSSITQRELHHVWHMEPTLTIFVSDRLKLDAIKIPAHINVIGLEDERRRLQKAQEILLPEVKLEAMQNLQQFDKERAASDEKVFDKRLKAIRNFIDKHRESIV